MSEQRKVVNSIGMFDLSRGLLMILIVLGHSITMYFKYWEVEIEMPLAWWLYPLGILKVAIYGMIPMFFIMSGYGFRKKKLLTCVKSQLLFMMKPYIYTGLVVTALTIAKCLLMHRPLKNKLIYQSVPFLLGLCPGEMEFHGYSLGSTGPMWFLIVMAISWILLNVIFMLENEAVRLLCILTMTAFCTRLPFISFVPFCLLQSMCCVGYLYIGYHVKKEKLLGSKIPKAELIVFCIILILVTPFGNTDISQNVWKLGFLDYIASAIAGYLLLRICYYSNRFEGKVANLLRTVGRQSLNILCVHSVEYLVVPWDKLADKMSGHPAMGVVIICILRGIIIFCGCVLITQIIKLKRKKRKNKRDKVERKA